MGQSLSNSARLRPAIGAVAATGLALGALAVVAPDVDATAYGATCDVVLNSDAPFGDPHWDRVAGGHTSSGAAYVVPVEIHSPASAGGGVSLPFVPTSSGSSVVSPPPPGVVICVVGSHPAIINGTAGPDTIYGGPGNETINGGDGDDVIIGGAGMDVLIGKAGSDSLEGGDGNDILFGYNGKNDPADITDGDDTLSGNNGDDLLRGDLGDDLLNGHNGDDCLLGGKGDDEAYGWNGHDTIGGGVGADYLAGNDNNDYIFGGKGSDTLRGNDGLDQIWGDSDLYDLGIEFTLGNAGALITAVAIGGMSSAYNSSMAVPTGVAPVSAFVQSAVNGVINVAQGSALSSSGPIIGLLAVPAEKLDYVNSSAVGGISVELATPNNGRQVRKFVLDTQPVPQADQGGISAAFGVGAGAAVNAASPNHIASVASVTVATAHQRWGHLEVAGCNLDNPRVQDDAYTFPLIGFSGVSFTGLATLHMSSIAASSQGDLELPLLNNNLPGNPGPSGAFLDWPTGWPTGDYHDNIRGGDSDDLLYGEVGNDTLFGDHGDDTVHGEGNAAAYEIAGAALNLAVPVSTVGGVPTVRFNGVTKLPVGVEAQYAAAAGDDSVNGNIDDDFLHGGAGDDHLSGGPDDDHLVGAAGTDDLNGGDHWDDCEPSYGFVAHCEIIL